MFKTINEEKAKLKVPIEKKVSKKLPVFYNPDMELNRSISIALLNSVSNNNMQIALPLAGSGVRGIRFLLELNKNKIENISFNDYSPKAVDLIKENLKLNNISEDIIEFYNKDANIFLLESNGFDYIDIDPFGSPNFLLNGAAMRISRKGILAVTATDTGALAGTFMEAGVRKYWSLPLHNELMHEVALRILIRKCQLIAGQFEKALVPIYSHATLHYDRAYFKVEKGRQKVDALFENHKYLLYCNKCMQRKVSEYNNEMCDCGNKFDYSGPMWVGDLFDSKLAQKIFVEFDDKLTSLIAEESKISVVGFYDLHKIAKKYNLGIPKLDVLIPEIKKSKHDCSRTHFSPYSIKSNIKLKKLIEIIKSLT